MKIKHVLIWPVCALLAVACFKPEPKGGVQFILQVITDDAVDSFLDESYFRLKEFLEKENIAVGSLKRGQLGQLLMAGLNPADEMKIGDIAANDFPDWGLVLANGQASLKLKTEIMRMIRNEALDQTLEVLKNRLNGAGVSDPQLEQDLGDRIIVRVRKKMEDPDRILGILKTRAVLEWKLVQAGPSLDEASLLQEYGGQLPEDMEVVPAIAEEAGGRFFLVNRAAFVTGRDIRSARAGRDQLDIPDVEFELTPAGGQRFGHISGENIGRRIAIILDGRVQSAPVVQDRIYDKGIISGRFTSAEVEDLVLMLKSGALPASIKVVEMKNL